MYLLTAVMRGSLADSDLNPIKSKEQQEADLDDAWNRLYTAKTAAQAKKEAWDKAKKDWEDATKKLQDLIDKRTQNLLDLVGENGSPPKTTTRQAAATKTPIAT
jgi:hypothetical protein